VSDPAPRKPIRLAAWMALAALLLVLAAVASLSIRVTPPSPAAQVTLTSSTLTPTSASVSTPQARRRLRPTLTVMPAARAERVTRTPGAARLLPTPMAQPATATPGVAGAVVCQETSGTVIDGMWRSEISRSDERYLLYLPPCYEYDLRQRYPTIYLLHGINSDDTFWESLGVFEKMDAGLRAGKYPPAVLVLADGNYELFLNTSGGPASYEAQIVEELIPIIEHLYHTGASSTMRAIGGISRGGVWSLEIGFRNPDLFSIVAGHSPCLHYNDAPFMLDPLKMNTYLSLKRQRIWLDAGDEDGCLPDTEDMHAMLDSIGASHAYNVWPGLHEASYWSAHLDDYLGFYTQEWNVNRPARLTTPAP
jgi:enterochelin esterase-like enzyme